MPDPSRGDDASGVRASPGLLVTGVALAIAVGGLAAVVATLLRDRSRVAPDAVALAIVAGVVLRALWRPPAKAAPGLAFAERRVLEIAIVALGISTDLGWLVRAGPVLVGSVVFATGAALLAGIVVGRQMRLTRSHAMLVASGNAICGNSAIAAVAAVIEAPPEESASAVTFTALMSIAIVLLLPAAAVLMGLSDEQFGTLAGLTVYSVPQVLAATVPVSVRAGEVGTLVKLVRVLMLVPLLLILAHRRGRSLRARGVALPGVFPRYIQLFLAAAVFRTAGLMPDTLVAHARIGSHALTVVAMAALGLSVDLRRLREVGWSTVVTACASLAVLAIVATLIATGLTPP